MTKIAHKLESYNFNLGFFFFFRLGCCRLSSNEISVANGRIENKEDNLFWMVDLFVDEVESLLFCLSAVILICCTDVFESTFIT